MRADRLVSVLLLLQRRRQITAAEVAAELEISARTARRDLEALAMAGLPVYSVAGRHGGWRLLGDGTTDLTGLSTPETVALFALIGTAASGHTDAISPATRTALAKLTGALPEPMRDAAERATRSTRVVAGGWTTGGVGGTPRPIPVAPELLAQLRDAIVETTVVRLAYRGRTGEQSTRDVHPLGLIDKRGRWYLVAITSAGQRTFRLDRVVDCTPTDARFDRPADFDLDAAWAAVESGVDELVWPATATALVAAQSIGLVQLAFGDRITSSRETDDGLVEIVVRGRHDAELAAVLAGFQPWLRVTGPPSLRALLHGIGQALIAEHAPMSH
jgi:predicted DNA-binding transcriptional regulator YafY